MSYLDIKDNSGFTLNVGRIVTWRGKEFRIEQMDADSAEVYIASPNGQIPHGWVPCTWVTLVLTDEERETGISA